MNMAEEIAKAKDALEVAPDSIGSGPQGGVVFEWYLMSSTLCLQFHEEGTKKLIYRTIWEPTKDQELHADHLGDIGCHSANTYMNKKGLTPSTVQPEDFVNVLLAIESKLARSSWHNLNKHKKNGRL